MSTIIRAVLTFKNPTKSEFIPLTNLLWQGTSLIDQQIYIAVPETKLIHYSFNKIDNLKLVHSLSLNEITPEFISKLQELQELK